MAPWNIHGDRVPRLSDCLRGGLGILRVQCSRCERRGAYDVRRALARHGDVDLRQFEKAMGIGADCPKRTSRLDAERCSIHCPDLNLLHPPICNCEAKERVRQKSIADRSRLNLMTRDFKKNGGR